MSMASWRVGEQTSVGLGLRFRDCGLGTGDNLGFGGNHGFRGIRGFRGNRGFGVWGLVLRVRGGFERGGVGAFVLFEGRG